MTASHLLSLLTDPPTWRGRALSGRTLDLLAVLAGGQDSRMSDGALIGALWPDDAPARPLRALHVVVSRARTAVGEGVVERTGDGYRLALPMAQVDALDLADRAHRARTCATEGQWDQVLDLTGALPRVPAPDEADVAGSEASPVTVLRARAVTQAEAAEHDRALALESTGEHERAADLLREAARRDPGDEAVLAALMRAESWARSPAAALEIYEEHRRRLREQGAVPGPAMRAAHEAVLAAESPVRRGLEPAPEHFLGREADVTGVLKALSAHRLVTLTGSGGVGKTTLAQVVAARSRRPAVYVAHLAEVAPGADLTRVLLDAVGNPPAADGDPRSSLAAALALPGTVLVLDNCEHLADEVADLVGPLLAACPDLRVLATSRRPLELGAEHVHRLAPLDTASAAELFRARALAARPEQVIDDEDLDDLLGRLDGIPLAIELAAARTRSLSARQIAERLPDRPELLTGARDAPARQRTLRAVIEWSWNLLDSAERRAMAHLALLADGFTLAAAEALIGADGADALDALVAHSLLAVRDRGLPRFHMLVTVRDFALEQLSVSGDETTARRALHEWVVDLCSQIRFPIDAGDFGAADHPQAHWHDRVFQQVTDNEAVIVQELDRLLAQADVKEPDRLPGELRDAICLIGAALMRLWSVTWSYERIADYGSRLIRPAAQPALDPRGNEAGLAVLALCVTLFGLLSHMPTQVRSLLSASFDGEGPLSRVRRFLRAGDEQWPELARDADPWVAWAATRCLAAQQEDDGDPGASLETIETLLDRLHGNDLAGIHLLELHLHRLQVLMSLGRYGQVVEACTCAQVLLERILPSWSGFFRTTLRLEAAYCAVCLDPRPQTADRLLESLDPVDLPGTMRFIARSVRGELELTRGRVRTAALTQRMSLRYAGHWRSILGAGSQWELYILSMCLITDIELSPDDAVELDAGAIRARAVRLLRDILSDPAPRQRDIPTVMAFAAAVGLSAAAAAPAGSPQRAAGAELVATALAVGTNQTCRLLSHDYLRTRTERLDARALAEAEDRIRPLDRGRLVAHAAGLARRMASETGWSR
ncbi:BTAD domain-containing putative transcriptional regulator [Actinomyces sp. ZJ308]|uniref:BTAD domain-containing putative transcriptional regulator n=1 Tax=Actinomyces sp. ZJ308 TaxID=2708342 RepID=UPI001FB93BDE|nr:BTAD domain-containing putative transcriptional regulator [Actinomyces sp. ZJ308]